MFSLVYPSLIKTPWTWIVCEASSGPYETVQLLYRDGNIMGTYRILQGTPKNTMKL